MKKMPLSLQIWALCTGVTLCIFGLIMLALPHMLNSFFTREVYALLEESQKSVQMITITFQENSLTDSLPSTVPVETESINNKASQQGSVIITQKQGKSKAETSVGPQSTKGRGATDARVLDASIGIVYTADAKAAPSQVFTVNADTTTEPISTVVPAMQILPDGPADNSSGLPPVNHILVNFGQNLGQTSSLPKAFIKAIQAQAMQQKQPVQRYSQQEGNQTLLYVIKKQNILGKSGYLLTYAWGSYTRELSSNLMQQLLWLMVVLCLISGIPSFFVARYLTRPLVEMERAARRISERNWQEALVSGRRDEIGRLARSFDRMRLQLAEQDEAQQSFLQNLSHELKTPAMVISSYAQAMLDGIYPRGSMEESVKVIKEESTRLQKRVHDFLYLNKLKYMALHQNDHEVFALDSLLEETVERLRWQRSDLEWKFDLCEVSIQGNQAQWGVALENLLDNQLRYAEGRVEITLEITNKKLMKKAELRVVNDGPPIEDHLLNQIFDPYTSGKNGHFGLGLAIFKQIMDIYEARVTVSNEDSRVTFYIEVDI